MKIDVSIIIPTKNKFSYLKKCLDSIKKHTKNVKYELIIINNNTTELDALRLIQNTKCRIIKFNKKFNFSKANNLAAQKAKGKYLLFLNNDVEVKNDWIKPLINQINKKYTGIVGAKLIYPNNRIQHAGISISKYYFVEHRFFNKDANFKKANKVSKCDAITGACLMIKKEVFLKIKGFDEKYDLECQDIDLCLKVKKKGLNIIYEPKSELIHHERITRLNNYTLEDIDKNRLRLKWLLKENFKIRELSFNEKKRMVKNILSRTLSMIKYLVKRN